MQDVGSLNQSGWDRRVEAKDIWTRPVSSADIDRARMGDWSILLTTSKPVPRDWLGDVAGKDVLCLASGGGQQGPILAAAGAKVSVFDASARQLAQDEAVALRDGLQVATFHGFMHDLSCFADGSFDLVINPASTCFAPELAPIWQECFRVLRSDGVLLTGFMNPDVYIFDADAHDRGELVPCFSLPYADTVDLPPDELARLIARDHVVEFSHTLQTQIGGQLAAGFLLAGFYEDRDREPTERSRFLPILFANRAIKPRASLPLQHEPSALRRL